ncbi:hypothetical protein [Streptomyces decoyicus]|uniref:hypothetical protein n=1 Tax=Streptomyces decoyicus TaxID=249567 RepID=UPI0033B99A22
MTPPTTVLALEFRGVRETADFGFLTAGARRTGVTRVDPLQDHVSGRLALTDQAQRLVDTLTAPPRLVLGYCASAGLAARIAHLAGAALILVDPDPVSADYVRQEADILCRALGVVPGGAAIPPTYGELAGFESLLLTSRDAQADVYGGDAEAYEMVDDLLGRYRAWLRFLDASAHRAPVTIEGAVTIVCGKPLPPLTGLLTNPESAHVHHVGSKGGTLDLPEVRTLLSDMVSARPAHQGPINEGLTDAE